MDQLLRFVRECILEENDWEVDDALANRDPGAGADFWQVLESNEEVDAVMNVALGAISADEFMESTAYDKLFQFYTRTSGAMPLDIARARSGDPVEWIVEELKRTILPQ